MVEAINETSRTKKEYFPVLDLVRFIAALLVIFIHIFPEGSTTASIGLDASIPTMISESVVYGILRPAVPIFFIISAFLLFRRIEADKENKWKYVGSFCLRLLFLYLFWYVLGLPLTIKDIAGFTSNEDGYGLLRYIIITLWKGAPRGYWFLVALALSVLIVNLVRNKKGLIIMSILAGLLYIYGCFNSAYFGLFASKDDPFSKTFFMIGNYLELSYCFLEAILFVVIGKLFALCGPFHIKGNLIFVILSFVLMGVELFLTISFNLLVFPDAYFLLPAFIFFFMNQMLLIKIEDGRFTKVAKKLKKVGSFSYLFHIQFFVYLHWILDATGNNIFRQYIALLLFPYALCVLLCFALQTLFEHLSQYKYLKFLRYSY